MTTDRKIIEFLEKSPLRSFSAMRDALRFWDDRVIPEVMAHEVLDDVRLVGIRGDDSRAMWGFEGHAREFGYLRRRVRRTKSPLSEDVEEVMEWGLTQSGSHLLKLLEVIAKTRALWRR